MMMHWRRTVKLPGVAAIIIILLVTMLAPGLALAQGTGPQIPIDYGFTVSSTLDDTVFEAVYFFDGTAGDVITVTHDATDGTLDPYLILYNQYPSQTPLAEDDDSGEGFNSMISNYVLPATGTYYIVATRFNRGAGITSGGFTLTLTLGAGGTGVSGGVFGGLPTGGGGGGVTIGGGGSTGGGQPAAQELSFTCTDNATGISVEVPSASRVVFEEVRPGFTYRVTVLGLDGFDPVIGLVSEGGDQLCNDDEPRAAGSQVAVPGVGLVEANTLTAQVQFTTSGNIGDIEMRIGGYGGAGGRYVAVFEGMAINPASEQDAVTINVSEATVGEDLFVYMVSQSASLDSYIFMDGSDFMCDDAGVGPCADVPAFPGGGVIIANGGMYVAGQYDAGLGIVPMDTGDRTFVFQSYSGRTAGNYAMIVIGASPGAGSTTTTTTTGTSGATTADGFPLLAYGDAVQNTINDTDWAWVYAFEGQAGDPVTITMERAGNSTVDPYLMLFDANEALVAEDDDSAGNLGSMIQLNLPSTGLFYIGATRFGQETGASSGAFTLSLSSGSAGTTTTGTGTTGGGSSTADVTSITYGDTVMGTLDNVNYSQLYTFDGMAGDIVTITMEAAISGGLDTYLGLLDGDTNVLAENDDSEAVGGFNSQVVHTLPANGAYIIVATRYGFEEGTSTGDYFLTISFEAGGATGSGSK